MTIFIHGQFKNFFDTKAPVRSNRCFLHLRYLFVDKFEYLQRRLFSTIIVKFSTLNILHSAA